ncbi:unnamed protein product [Discosporangium mesarthrocarpum]
MIEIQFRTQVMHADAEDGVAAHSLYKGNLGDPGDASLFRSKMRVRGQTWGKGSRPQLPAARSSLSRAPTTTTADHRGGDDNGVGDQDVHPATGEEAEGAGGLGHKSGGE